MSEVYEALLKKAVGYQTEEEVKEFDSEDTLLKKKITIKNVPPDTAAAKACLEFDNSMKKYSEMTLKQLKSEARKIYKEIKEITDGNKENQSHNPL